MTSSSILELQRSKWPETLVVYLAEQEDRWVPVFLPGHLEQAFAHIHSQTHEVRLEEVEHLADRYVVVLGR